MKGISDATIHRHLKSRDWMKRAEIAQRRDWTPGISDVNRGLSDLEERVRVQWAHRTDVTWTNENVVRLLSDPSTDVRTAFIMNNSWRPTSNDWELGLNSADDALRCAWHGRRDCPVSVEVVDRMSEDPVRRIRQILADRLDLPAYACRLSEVIRGRLLGDANDHVRETTIKKWPFPFPEEVLEWGLTHPAWQTRFMLINRHDWTATRPILERGLELAYENARAGVDPGQGAELCAWIDRPDFVPPPAWLPKLLGSPFGSVRLRMSNDSRWWWQRGASAFLEAWIRRKGIQSWNRGVRLACVVRPGKAMGDIQAAGFRDSDPLVRFLWITR